MNGIRDYLYLDDGKVCQYLEQLLEGARSDVTYESTEGRRRSGGVKGSLGIGGAHGELESGSETKTKFSVSTTATSRAAQLEELLDLAPLGPMDDDAFSTVAKGEFVTMDATLRVPEVIQKVFTAAALGQLAGLVSAVRAELANFDETMTQLDAIRQLVELDGFPVTAEDVAGGPGAMFIARPALIRGEPISLDGEDVTVIGRVKRVVLRGETVQQSELLPRLSPHLSQPNRAQRRQSGSARLQVRLIGPAVLLDPVVIYQ